MISKVRKAIWSVLLRLGRCLLVFLDIIGLYSKAKRNQEQQLDRFRLHHTEFRSLLQANDSFLAVISSLEELIQKQRVFDVNWVQNQVLRASADVFQMIKSLNAIAEDRYISLFERYQNIANELDQRQKNWQKNTAMPWVLDLDSIQEKEPWLVGGKIANLAALRNGAGLLAPDGFAMTSQAYHHVVFCEGIQWIFSESGNAEAQIQHAVLSEQLKTVLFSAYERLTQRRSFAPRLAVRSSALGEDSNLSFAGLFHTALNVSQNNLCQAYLDVLQSLFSPKAAQYRRMHALGDASLAMAVGCVEMIDAIISGVAFSLDPADPQSKNILIHAVRGLGVSLVDGHTSPEVVKVSREPCLSICSRIPSKQEVAFYMHSEEGLKEEVLSSEETENSCLSQKEALHIATCALKLEQYFGCPQDIEWAMDEKHQIWFLQSRPLTVINVSKTYDEPVSGFRLLVSSGETACPGVACGPVIHMDENGDLATFPQGAVLVAPRSSPRFIQVMSKAKAIATDVGSTTGHMATLAREFHVPTLVNTGSATSKLKPGMTVTIDARNGRIYEGEVSDLLQQELQHVENFYCKDIMRGTPPYNLMESLSELLVPLNLTNPNDASFVPEKCRTLHDIARLVHEKSYQEMFHMGARLGDMKDVGVWLDVFLPIDLCIFDLGNGMDVPSGTQRIKPSQIRSFPMSALLRGLLDKRIPRFGAKPMDLGGFLGIMARHAIESPEQSRTFRDPCYALISDRYLNYTARVGYHFSVVDAYCGKSENKNYISLLFRGGAADFMRRERRVKAIAGILEHFRFSVSVESDALYARLAKRSQSEIEAHLEMIGRLLQFFRQMDAAMISDIIVQELQAAFLSEDYDLSQWSAKLNTRLGPDGEKS